MNLLSTPAVLGVCPPMPRRLAQSPPQQALSAEETSALLACLQGSHWLMGALVYGSGLRAEECLGLRVRDLDLMRRRLLLRDQRGGCLRGTVLPQRVLASLAVHLEKVRQLHADDLAHGRGGAWLPPALARRYRDGGREWGWQYVFPSSRLLTEPGGAPERRRHLDPLALERTVAEAGRRAGIRRPLGTESLRQAFRARLLEAGWALPAVDRLLGEGVVIDGRGGQWGAGVMRSPLDDLPAAAA